MTAEIDEDDLVLEAIGLDIGTRQDHFTHAISQVDSQIVVLNQRVAELREHRAGLVHKQQLAERQQQAVLTARGLRKVLTITEGSDHGQERQATPSRQACPGVDIGGRAVTIETHDTEEEEAEPSGGPDDT